MEKDKQCHGNRLVGRGCWGEDGIKICREESRLGIRVVGRGCWGDEGYKKIKEK